MKLSYRGVNYDTHSSQQGSVPSVPATDLKYRGATYRLNQVAKAEALEAILKYRGVAHTNPSTSQGSQPNVKTTVSLDDRARALSVSHHQLIKNRQQVMLSRSAAELGLAANVVNYWNHIQGQIHPTFRTNYDRSHATFS